MNLAVAILAGLLTAVGITIVIGQVLPTPPPDLRSALERLNAPLLDAASAGRLHKQPARYGLVPGGWVSALRSSDLINVPRTDLAILGRSVDEFVAAKVSAGLVGLVLLPVIDLALLLAAGAGLPFLIPIAGSLVLGLLCFLLPDVQVRRSGAAARMIFIKVLYKYLYQVALQRRGSVGVLQALQDAAALGDSWVIVRIRNVLKYANNANIAPWGGLEVLADQIGVPQLAEAAATLRAASTESIGAYDRLVAQADGLRDDIRTREHAVANSRSDLLVIPTTILAIVIVAIMVYPMLLRLP